MNNKPVFCAIEPFEPRRLMSGECMMDCVATEPMTSDAHHSGGVNVLFGDGSVRFAEDAKGEIGIITVGESADPDEGGEAGIMIDWKSAVDPDEGGEVGFGLKEIGVESGGVNVALADGSVRFISDSIATTTWNVAADPDEGGETRLFDQRRV